MGSSRLRYWVLTLVVIAIMLNYVDRQIIALLKPILEQQFGWNDADYGDITTFFQLGGTVAVLFAGRFVDRTGLKSGYAWGVGVWSLAEIAHTVTRTVTQFSAARLVLGVAESVNTPAAVKSMATWFPQKDRSLALGIMNAAPNIGAIATPLLIPWLALTYGWRETFFITGVAGLVWLVIWLALPKPPKRIEVHGESKPRPVPWRQLMDDRYTWIMVLGKLMTDPVWWLLLFWAPDFFDHRYHLNMAHIGLPIATIYLMAMIGAFLGGWLQSLLIRRGLSVNAARKIPMLIASFLVLPLPLVLLTSNYWVAVLLVGTALAGHQAFSTNLFGLAADSFPHRAVGSVIGISAFAGNLGGLAILFIAGILLNRYHSYLPLFAYAAIAYLVVLALINWIAPRLRLIEEN
ncbi:MFS transporter [Oleiagrimonas sp.]|uniref:MFS transporter n=1 Tax=Oleiagrimonas sp. TaxID=2010330 RepID=UPI00260C7351|nr:MFS transporter [Oleiagrimonas sp.]MDA3913741.1 MFS transporter [Oleiagrimonas sp.]